MIRPSSPLFVRACLMLAGLLLATDPAIAARGLTLSAYGAEGLGLGGADVAIARDITAMNVNPAGLAQLKSRGWDASIYPYYLRVSHQDSLGNDSGVDDPYGAILAGAYAQRLQSFPDLVVGAGLFASGGTGFGYESLLTDYGSHDTLSSNIGIFKLLGSVAWNASEQLRLGAAFGVSYAIARQKAFPNTSDNSNPAEPFFGLRFDGGQAVAPNLQLGLQYLPTPTLTLALTYNRKTELAIKNGTATFNFEAIGFDRVRYEKARIDGFALPEEIDVGVAYQLHPRWLLAVEFNWLAYSNALQSSRLRASVPNKATPLASINAVSPLNWNDLYVYAFGVAHTLDERNTLRGGFTLQNNPIPDATANPTLNLGQRYDITAGYGRKLDNGWTLDLAAEYQLPVDQDYRNAALPLGERATEHYEDISAIIAISRRW